MLNYAGEVRPAWTPRVLSVGVHIVLIALALIPWASRLPIRPALSQTTVLLYTLPVSLPELLLPPGRAGGGGGGGRHALTPASRGQLPRAADKQIVPPDPEPPKNPNPELIVDPTIVAPQLAQLPSITLLNIGDPNGVVGPPSAGQGGGGGIGDGDGHGVGDDRGPGAGPGNDGGTGGGGRRPGGGVTGPTLIYRVEPQYSEEARKARYEGTVVLETIVRQDGGIEIVRVVRSLGFGLDQSAIDAVKRWRFRPGTKNGRPVDVPLKVEVSFNLR